MNLDNMQFRFFMWAKKCFGIIPVVNKQERYLRFIEEAVELAQIGLTEKQVIDVVKHVYSRSSGKVSQEIGGVLNCLANLATSEDVHLSVAAEEELTRITANIDKIREKQNEKPDSIKGGPGETSGSYVYGQKEKVSIPALSWKDCDLVTINPLSNAVISSPEQIKGTLHLSSNQIKHMVERFLQWRLPENFNPDAGISFKPLYNEQAPWGPSKHEPVGTNLFDYAQTEEMVKFILKDLPVS